MTQNLATVCYKTARSFIAHLMTKESSACRAGSCSQGHICMSLGNECQKVCTGYCDAGRALICLVMRAYVGTHMWQADWHAWG